jgi:hypothetical protein
VVYTAAFIRGPMIHELRVVHVQAIRRDRKNTTAAKVSPRGARFVAHLQRIMSGLRRNSRCQTLVLRAALAEGEAVLQPLALRFAACQVALGQQHALGAGHEQRGRHFNGSG